MAGKYKIICDQGSTLRRTLTINAQATTPTPWNLTGFSARMHVRTTIEATTTVLELGTDIGGLEITATPGELLLEVSATDTAALTAAIYVYDLEVESPSGIVTRLLEGSFVVRREVTR